MLYCTIYILLSLVRQDGYFNACVNVFWRNLGPHFFTRDSSCISQSEPFSLAICHMPHCQWHFYLPSNPSKKQRLTIPGRIIGIYGPTTCSIPEPNVAKHSRKAYLQTKYTEFDRAAPSSICQWSLKNLLHGQIGHSPQSWEVQRWQNQVGSISCSAQS